MHFILAVQRKIINDYKSRLHRQSFIIKMFFRCSAAKEESHPVTAGANKKDFQITVLYCGAKNGSISKNGLVAPLFIRVAHYPVVDEMNPRATNISPHWGFYNFTQIK